jgi:hypothetical protein
MRRPAIPNRNLTPSGSSSSGHKPEISMSDIIFLATGLGTFGLLALYARSLGRI